MIRYLFAGTVYYVRHFVGYDEFLVLYESVKLVYIKDEITYLSGKTVTDEKTILYFDSSNHILRKLILHLFHLMDHILLLNILVHHSLLLLVILLGLLATSVSHSHKFLLLLL